MDDSIDLGADSPPIKFQSKEFEPFRNAFIKVAQSVIPSVVSVIPTRTDTQSLFGNSFQEFFPDRFNYKQQDKVQGIASGFIVSKKGYLLTNYHVIVGASEIDIILANGNIYPAQIIGSDSLSDLCVLKITGKLPELTPVYMGNSDSLQPGTWISAIGNPFALTSTITSGIVSALGRQIADTLTYQNFIQIDAAINPGNSGGPLVNLEGAVVGINSLIFSQSGGFMGVGFAIPINMAKKVMKDIIYHGRVIRGYIGISIQAITPELMMALELETNNGAIVADVVKDQPADKAGIKTGDIITSFANNKIENANELQNIIADVRPGKEVSVIILRKTKIIKSSITPIERSLKTLKKQPQISSRIRSRRGIVKNKLGIEVIDITPELRKRFTISDNVKGVIVTVIRSDIYDQRTTLVPGSVISRAKTSATDWTEINSVSDFNSFSNSVKKDQAVVFQVLQADQTLFVAFRIE